MITVIELFAGIGAQHMALEQLHKDFGLEYEILGISEIDKAAIKAYNAIHGETYNFGDISKITRLPKATLWTYSFPCTDISIAGKQAGFDKTDDANERTRSGLLWEVERLLLDAKERGVEPDYLLMENVDAILNKKNIDNFKKWLMALDDMGYTTSYEVMNAKDYGVPQNRKRVFAMSAKNGKVFKFPQPIPLDRCLKDVLETDVDESFFLSEERLKKYQSYTNTGDKIPQPPLYTREGKDGKLMVSGQCCKEAEAKDGDGISISNPTQGGKKVMKGIAPTLKAGVTDGVCVKVKEEVE